MPEPGKEGPEKAQRVRRRGKNKGSSSQVPPEVTVCHSLPDSAYGYVGRGNEGVTPREREKYGLPNL